VVNRHYVEVLGPLLERAKATGQLSPGADLDAFLALLMLVLPHLVMASANPELDAVLGLGRNTRRDSEHAVDRLLEVFRHGLGRA